MKKILIWLPFLTFIGLGCGIKICTGIEGQIDGQGNNKSGAAQSSGIGGTSSSSSFMLADAGVCPSPATPEGCSRCNDALLDASKADKLCQNFDGIPGGIPSEWLYEHTVSCICVGACSDMCQAACQPDAMSEFIVDQKMITPDCQKCIENEPHKSIDPAGCGAQLSLCKLDFTP